MRNRVPDLEKAYRLGLKRINIADVRVPIGGHWNERVLHVSDMGYAIKDGKCPRQLQLRLAGAEKYEGSDGEHLRFAHGNIIHAVATEILKKGLPDYWTIYGAEVSVSEFTPPGLYGTADLVLLGKGGETVVVDYKTVRGNKFKYLNKVDNTYKIQVQTYGKYLSATGLLILYIDREGDNFVKQFRVRKADKTVEKVYQRLVEIANSDLLPILEPKVNIRKNKGDDAVYISQPWTCDYCHFQDHSCKGALPFKYRDIKHIAGHLNDEEGFIPDKRVKGIEKLVAELI